MPAQRQNTNAALPPVPDVIPPRSIVRLVRFDRSAPHWKLAVGRRFRIGYYRPADGLDCIWLVNEGGEYEQTTTRQTLLQFFEIEKLSREKDFFGASRPALTAIRRKDAGHVSSARGRHTHVS